MRRSTSMPVRGNHRRTGRRTRAVRGIIDEPVDEPAPSGNTAPSENHRRTGANHAVRGNHRRTGRRACPVRESRRPVDEPAPSEEIITNRSRPARRGSSTNRSTSLPVRGFLGASRAFRSSPNRSNRSNRLSDVKPAVEHRRRTSRTTKSIRMSWMNRTTRCSAICAKRFILNSIRSRRRIPPNRANPPNPPNPPNPANPANRAISIPSTFSPSRTPDAIPNRLPATDVSFRS